MDNPSKEAEKPDPASVEQFAPLLKYKLDQLSIDNRDGRIDNLSKLTTPEFQPIGKKFKEDIERIVLLCEMPSLIMYRAFNFGALVAQAFQEVTANEMPIGREWGIEEIQEENVNQNVSRRSPILLQSYEKHDAYDRIVALRAGHRNLVVEDGYLGGRIGQSIEAILRTVIVEGWTAFETMAGELWESALNVHPQTLCLMEGIPKRKSKGIKYLPNDFVPPKNVGIVFLNSNNYDPSKVMGTYYKTEEKEIFKFTSWWNIRNAFLAAFSERTESIDEVLIGGHHHLNVFSQLRNLAVHQSLKVNQHFMDYAFQSCKELRVFQDVRPGHTIALDGYVVAFLLNGLVKLSSSLLKHCDDWVQKH